MDQTLIFSVSLTRDNWDGKTISGCPTPFFKNKHISMRRWQGNGDTGEKNGGSHRIPVRDKG
jgi:hypothetical protein